MEQPVPGEGADGGGDGQIGDAGRVEPQGAVAAGALREPARDRERGDTDGDVAQAEANLGQSSDSGN